MADHAGRFPPDGIGHRRIERLHQDAVPAARTPDEIRGGRPGDIADVARREAPGEGRAGARGPCGPLSDFVLRDDRNGRIRMQRAREAYALLRGEHFEWIRQTASTCNDEPTRHGDREVDVAVLEIELALAEVLLRVPAAHVVVDGEARIPLRDLVQPSLGELLASHAVGAVLRNLKRVADLE